MTYYASPNRIKQYLDCALLASIRGRASFTNDAIEDGSARHAIIEHYYLTGEWVDDPARPEANAQVAQARQRYDFFPPREWTVSVEGSNIPPQNRYTSPDHGAEMFRVDLGGGVGIEGVADWIGVDPMQQDVLVGIDWKGRKLEGEDHEVQMGVYAVASAALFPASHYHWEIRYVSEPWRRPEVYDYTPDEVEKVRESLRRIITRMRDDRELVPTPSGRCAECPIRSACTAFAAHKEGIINGSLVAANSDVGMPLEKRIEYRQRLSAAKKIVEAESDRVREDLTAMLSRGPQVVAGRQWYLLEKVARYSVNPDKAFQLARLLNLSFEPGTGVLKLDDKAFEEQAKRAIKLIADKDPELGAQWTKLLDECWTPQRTTVISSKAA